MRASPVSTEQDVRTEAGRRTGGLSLLSQETSVPPQTIQYIKTVQTPTIPYQI